ncbi:hypothetical protein F5B20DRAFT_596518 [Whalleya microplaca]|nr:hypothetical protein F5B20DRAFT_596518 [Whalleya microplaca]
MSMVDEVPYTEALLTGKLLQEDLVNIHEMDLRTGDKPKHEVRPMKEDSKFDKLNPEPQNYNSTSSKPVRIDSLKSDKAIFQETIANDENDPNEDQANREDDLDKRNGTSKVEYPRPPQDPSEFKPKARRVNYHDFKNLRTEKDLRWALDCLYGGVSLRPDIQREVDGRGSLTEQAKDIGPRAKNGEKGVDGRVMLHRIRINSPCVIKYLYTAANLKCSGEDAWIPRTFFRPFRPLLHLHEKMKEDLEKLQNTYGRDVYSKNSTPEPNASNSLIGSKEAFMHMRGYVNFIDKEVIPLWNRFSSTENQEVLFSDLWYLFREGDLIYHPVPTDKRKLNNPNSSGNASSLLASHQTIWKIYQVITAQVPDDPDDFDRNPVRSGREHEGGMLSNNDTYEYSNVTSVWCYYIDFDGEVYSTVHRRFSIPHYEGKTPIKSLLIYPLKYLEDSDKILEKQEASGRHFTSYVHHKHASHYGWTLTHSPTGSVFEDIDKHPEHIDSEVIIDFPEAYQKFASWKPDTYVPFITQLPFTAWEVTEDSEDTVYTRLWSTNSKGEYENRRSLTTRYDICGKFGRNKFLESNDFLLRLRKDEYVTPSNQTDLCLFPKRLVAFSLRDRKFVNISINCLKPTKHQPNVFESLKIDENHKRMIRSLVKEHIMGKKLRLEDNEVMGQDLIRGKGSGLVFLLHGVPGVGKTATAEAVAQENSCPLFTITCGDLSTKPAEVERNMTEIFRLANIWNCILLLDEADIFFTQRSPSDLERNALVTVFLRILEYYNGILFLTTNRVGIIDEAFKSRIHVSLYYPPLDFGRTMQIFETNLQRLETIEENRKDNEIQMNKDRIRDWAQRHFTENDAVGRWNGRQIRNAFQIAASLARFDILDAKPGGDEDLSAGVLSEKQFTDVFKATMEFDVYMAKARKGFDLEVAKREGIRHDVS